MSRTTATAVHAAAVVLVVLLALPVGSAYGAGVAAHDHPAPSPAATPMADMPGMSAEEHAAMGHANHLPAAAVGVNAPGASDSTRAAVIGGFGVVNAVAVGSALVLRRRGATGRRPRFAR